MCKTNCNYETERIKRLGEQDFWYAMDMSFAQVQAVKPVCGDYRCRNCGFHFDPTVYGKVCPECGRFKDAPADWPNEREVQVIEAGHRGPPERVSWNSGPVLFDYQRADYVGA